MIWSNFLYGFHITRNANSFELNMVDTNNKQLPVYNLNTIKFSNQSVIIPLQDIIIKHKIGPKPGFDERFNKTNNDDDILEILKNHNKQQLLYSLLDDKLSLFSKMELLINNCHLIDIDQIAKINTTGGGLFRDFFIDF